MMEPLKVLDTKNHLTIIFGILTPITFMMTIIGIAVCLKFKKGSSKNPKSSYDNSEGKDTKDKVNTYANS